MRIVLSIAGSDSGAGAGTQADLKTFAALDVYGTTAVTAITAQNTVAMRDIFVLPPALVAAQLDAVLSDLGADAAKTGMLADAIIVAVVAQKMAEYHVPNLVVDPAMVAKTGDPLLAADALVTLRERLLPLARVATPNLPEAEALVQRALPDPADRRWAARRLREMGVSNVVIKGGHVPGDDVIDLLYDGREFVEFRSPRLAGPNTHGTGCTFSAALAAYLAHGKSVLEAVALAKDYVAGAIAHATPLGKGYGPLNHMWRR